MKKYYFPEDTGNVGKKKLFAASNSLVQTGRNDKLHKELSQKSILSFRLSWNWSTKQRCVILGQDNPNCFQCVFQFQSLSTQEDYCNIWRAWSKLQRRLENEWWFQWSDLIWSPFTSSNTTQNTVDLEFISCKPRPRIRVLALFNSK